jgi:Transposase family tnp2
MSNMSRKTFDQMRFTFRHKIDLDSGWVILHRMAILSGVEPVNYDCCVNSCMAYTGKYQHREDCPFCNEPRYTTKRHARRTFMYLPLIPRLQSFHQSKSMIEKLSYRHHYQCSDDRIRDVFDSSHYRQLLQRNVVIDGIERPYKYFSGKRDIALAISVDGYLLFKRQRKGPSATPILVQIYNLPPEIRTHHGNLICVGIIPGPHPPKDYASYLVPYDNECVELAYGVSTFDAVDRVNFSLRGYTILEHGDILAIEKLLGIKGHNAVHPCRSCNITGIRDITGNGKVYYVPLTTPNVEHQTRISIDPRSLPLRKHEDFDRILRQMDNAKTTKDRVELAKRHGIRNAPALRRVGSIDHANSYPWEWMHLFCENIIPNLVSLWTGRFKGLGPGAEDYELPAHTWDQIGRETANAVKLIPASFVRVLGNISEERSKFTAESWGFWLMYLAPILLNNRFSDDKYYTHMCALVKIMKTTLKFELTLDELDTLEAEIVEWVELYEE